MNFSEAVALFELPENYNEVDVNRSYRKLASKHHPDKGGDSEYMRKIIEAKQLLDEENLNNTTMTVKQFEVVLQTIETKKTQIAKYEKIVEKLESVATNRVVGSLKNQKNIAYIASAIFLGAIFLSKEVPKEIFSLVNTNVIEKPTIVQEPILTLAVKNELDKDKWDFGAEVQEGINTTPDAVTQESVNKYNHELKQYNKYVEKSILYQNQQNELNRFKFMWYSLMFCVAGYSGALGWLCQSRVRRVELDLEELMSNLSLKSRYVLILKEVFGGSLPSQWTLEDFETALVDSKLKNRMLCKLHVSLGTNKLCQLLIAKGQENSFISVVQGNEENEFQEIYRL